VEDAAGGVSPDDRVSSDAIDDAPATTLEDGALERRSRGPWAHAARRYLRHPLGVAALTGFTLILVAGLLGGHLATYAENEIDLTRVNQASGPTFAGHHYFGTDYLGRDLFSQTMYGLHTSVLLTLAVVGVTALFGVLVGALAGYGGGWLDAMLMRAVDLVVTVPLMAVMLAALVYFEPLTPNHMAVVMSLYLWTGVARVTRASFASLRAREFIEAAHAAGASPVRIALRHMLPNCSGPIIVAATSVFGIALTIEATLDFFNIGSAQVSTGGPTLGNLIADATKYGGLVNAPWWTYTMPALVLVLLLLSVNFVDSLDDTLAPDRVR
jgi:ABC-type dipeptide/oligopeptide/nickel transport system permease subunit